MICVLNFRKTCFRTAESTVTWPAGWFRQSWNPVCMRHGAKLSNLQIPCCSISSISQCCTARWTGKLKESVKSCAVFTTSENKRTMPKANPKEKPCDLWFPKPLHHTSARNAHGKKHTGKQEAKKEKRKPINPSLEQPIKGRNLWLTRWSWLN